MPPLRPCHSRRERAGIVPPAPPHIRHSRRPAIARRLAPQLSFGRPRSRRRQPPLTLPAPECRKRPLVVDRRRAAAGCRAGSRLQRRLLSALRFWQAVAPAGPLVSTLLQRSEEHTSELQSLMRISYAVFCMKKNNKYTNSSLIKIH